MRKVPSSELRVARNERQEPKNKKPESDRKNPDLCILDSEELIKIAKIENCKRIKVSEQTVCSNRLAIKIRSVEKSFTESAMDYLKES